MPPTPSQLDLLRALLETIAVRNPFQSARLAVAGLDHSIASLEEFSKKMPLTRKADLVADQAKHPPHGSNLTFPLDQYIRFSQTTGTTGEPLVWLDTAESWEWMLENWMLVYKAAGVTPRDRIYFAFSFGPFLGFWTAFEAAARLGCLCLPGGGMSSAARLRALIRQRTAILCCTPTYALRLAEVAAEEGIDLATSAIRTIIVAGEPGGSASGVRQAVAASWNSARLFDHYGMTEVGPVAYQDGQREQLLRIPKSRYYAEILDRATGEPVKPGETGELVLTPLGRIAAPLLRYATGDLVRLSDAGNEETVALEGGILGRVDDMLVIRGVNIYPSALDDVVRSAGGVTEYQVDAQRDDALAQLEVKIETGAGSDPSVVARQLESALNSAFSLRIPVTVVAEGSLPRFEMKARRWMIKDST